MEGGWSILENQKKKRRIMVETWRKMNNTVANRNNKNSGRFEEQIDKEKTFLEEQSLLKAWIQVWYSKFNYTRRLKGRSKLKFKGKTKKNENTRLKKNWTPPTLLLSLGYIEGKKLIFCFPLMLPRLLQSTLDWEARWHLDHPESGAML